MNCFKNFFNEYKFTLPAFYKEKNCIVPNLSLHSPMAHFDIQENYSYGKGWVIHLWNLSEGLDQFLRKDYHKEFDGIKDDNITKLLKEGQKKVIDTMGINDTLTGSFFRLSGGMDLFFFSEKPNYKKYDVEIYGGNMITKLDSHNLFLQCNLITHPNIIHVFESDRNGISGIHSTIGYYDPHFRYHYTRIGNHEKSSLDKWIESEWKRYARKKKIKDMKVVRKTIDTETASFMKWLGDNQNNFNSTINNN